MVDVAEKRIRTRSTPNVETERLVGRLDYFRANLARLGRERCEQKNQFRALAREVVNIERELTRRGIAFVPVTDGAHLCIDVWQVREIRPSSSRRG